MSKILDITNHSPDEIFIIAEGGINHNGSLKTAKKLVDAAKNAGCDAIKFQTWKTELVYDSIKSQVPEYQERSLGPGQNEYEIIKQHELSWEDFRELNDYAKQKDIIFFSTPDEKASLDFLVSLDVPVIKIGSQDLTNRILLNQVLKTGKPIILSTGAASLSEVAKAVEILETADLYLLHCVSAYPTLMHQTNLKAIETLKNAFNLPVGFSDHTRGYQSALVALGLGARIFEKHLTLDPMAAGPDHQASMSPIEMQEYCTMLRGCYEGLGNGIKRVLPIEENVRKSFKRFPVAANDIQPGQLILESNLNLKKTVDVIDSIYWELLVKSRATRFIPKGKNLSWDDVEIAEN